MFLIFSIPLELIIFGLILLGAGGYAIYDYASDFFSSVYSTFSIICFILCIIIIIIYVIFELIVTASCYLETEEKKKKLYISSACNIIRAIFVIYFISDLGNVKEANGIMSFIALLIAIAIF